MTKIKMVLQALVCGGLLACAGAQEGSQASAGSDQASPPELSDGPAGSGSADPSSDAIVDMTAPSGPAAMPVAGSSAPGSDFSAMDPADDAAADDQPAPVGDGDEPADEPADEASADSAGPGTGDDADDVEDTDEADTDEADTDVGMSDSSDPGMSPPPSEFEQLFPWAGGTGTGVFADYEPLPENGPECPQNPPDNPLGPCVGLPVYLPCGWTDGTVVYSCICDWVHWLCI